MELDFKQSNIKFDVVVKTKISEKWSVSKIQKAFEDLDALDIFIDTFMGRVMGFYMAENQTAAENIMWLALSNAGIHEVVESIDAQVVERI